MLQRMIIEFTKTSLVIRQRDAAGTSPGKKIVVVGLEQHTETEDKIKKEANV